MLTPQKYIVSRVADDPLTRFNHRLAEVASYYRCSNGAGTYDKFTLLRDFFIFVKFVKFLYRSNVDNFRVRVVREHNMAATVSLNTG